MLNYFLQRAQEPSTWRGASLFLTAVGIYVNPAMYQLITTIGVGAAGLIGMLTADKTSVK